MAVEVEEDPESLLKIGFWFIKKCGSVDAATAVVKLAGEALIKFKGKRANEHNPKTRMQCSAAKCDASGKMMCVKCDTWRVCGVHNLCYGCSLSEPETFCGPVGVVTRRGNYDIVPPKVHYAVADGTSVCNRKAKVLAYEPTKVTCKWCLKLMEKKHAAEVKASTPDLPGV